MEFTFNVNALFKDEITVIDRNNELLKYNYHRSYSKDNSLKEQLREIINKLGSSSAKAQNLNVPITSADQLASAEQRCYLLKSTCQSLDYGAVVGFLKVGPKKLFFVNLEAQQVEVTPLCVLDFYVHESCQRQGYGLKLFNFMLQTEGVTPGSLAIDRPSDKMLSFYKKRFNLATPLKQPNNFVVFRDFFKNYTATSSKRWPDHQKRGPIMLKAINQRKTMPEETDESTVSAGKLAPASDFKLPNVLDRPLSSLVGSPSPTPTQPTATQPTATQPTATHAKNKPAAQSAHPKSYHNSREKSFSWTRHNINPTTQNYVVGNLSIVQSRYTQYNRPRPF